MPDGSAKLGRRPYRKAEVPPPEGTFDGYFKLEPDPSFPHIVTPGETNLIERLNNTVDVRRTPGNTHYIIESNRNYEELSATVASIAEDFLSGVPTEDCLFNLGKAVATREAVQIALDNAERRSARTLTEADGDLKQPVDLKFELGDGVLSDEQAQLVAGVRKAVTVVSIVFVDRTSPEHRRRRGAYITQLCKIADSGLQSQASAATALRELQAFREAFVDHEASAVKNRYLRNLGIRVASIGTALLVLFLFAMAVEVRPGTGVLHSALGERGAARFGEMVAPMPSFLLLAFGACIGTWLSFALRRPNLTFEQLSLLEEDRLAPLARIFFVVGLTLVIGMLLYTDLLSIKIGDVGVDIGDPNARAALPIALALGLMCGIAERALAEAVRSRAEDIVGSAAGNAPKSGAGHNRGAVS
jgi:hypothetical protein